MSEWKKVRLGEVAYYVMDRSEVMGLALENYISTENMLPDKGGVSLASSVPSYGSVTEFCHGDVLVSNIRPYFKKIWKATRDGFCSNDILVLRCKDCICCDFLFFALSNDAFFDYVMASAKGTKMPRGDKQQILEYSLSIPPLPTQRKIAAVLGALDDKIENNRKICANLEAQAQAIFKSWFVDFEPFGGKMPQGWKMGKLGDVAECNPYRALKKGVKARCVEMADLVTSASFPASWSYKEYSGGMKFANGDTIIARITPCFENGKAAYVNFLEEGEVAFGSTEYVVMASRSVVPPELFYCVAKDPDFISFAKSRMVGSSGRQRFSAEDIAMYPIAIAPDEVYLEVQPLLHSFMDQARMLGFESRALAAMRDALLPKLMSGEIDVEKVEVA